MKNKKILLGITGSIAAYKAAFLTRLLIKRGAEVKVIMTKAAGDFITPLTFSTLSKNPVYSDVSSESGWNNHVELGLWADAMIIAPATANTLAKLANGICDNMIAACYLSARCPVFVAPAMDLDMWTHPATTENIERLKRHKVDVIPVGHGELASGLVGNGRMAEPEYIVTHLQRRLEAPIQDLKGKNIVVTAGPTYEPLDPVRFIGNHSSGKMGVEIANNLANRGAHVTLVLGPSKLKIENKQINVIRVTTANEMFRATQNAFATANAGILAAAVADYRPATFSNTKIKKKSDDMRIDLEKTTDIAATLGKSKKAGQLLIGFALETNNEKVNAQKKLEKKNFDFIVLNSLQDKGAGFNHDTNKITIIHANNKMQEFELKSKKAVAKDIVDALVKAFDA